MCLQNESSFMCPLRLDNLVKAYKHGLDWVIYIVVVYEWFRVKDGNPAFWKVFIELLIVHARLAW